MYVYVAINTINQSIYIGMTKNSIEKRMKSHFYDAFKNRTNRLFHIALRKYGKEAFVWEIVDNSADNYEELSKKEIESISKFKSMGYILYNMTEGGEGIHIDNSGEKNGMKQATGSKNPTYGSGYAVKCLNDEKVYISSDAAEKYYNIANVGAVCRGLRSHSKGYRFKYVSKDAPEYKRKPCSEERKRKISESNIGKNKSKVMFEVFDLEKNKIVWTGSDRIACSKQLQIPYQGISKNVNGVHKRILYKRYKITVI